MQLHLTQPAYTPIPNRVSRLDGRSGKHRKVAGEESPGSTDIRCRITSGEGEPASVGTNLRESATESRPPLPLRKEAGAVRVKGCGKSAPRRRQRRRHGKPHREQDQVGATAPAFARGSGGGGSLTRGPGGARGGAGSRAGRPGRSREARGDTGPRGMAISRLSGRGQNPAYRPPAPS